MIKTTLSNASAVQKLILPVFLRTYKFVRTRSFSTNDDYDIRFNRSDDGLGGRLKNPQSLMLVNSTVTSTGVNRVLILELQIDFTPRILR